ncbi:DNA-binding transcriptional regulator, MocR family, contains an aminotransferase domain [Streptoalloteichus tenebrarius]|uniref:DNA-binding transcriptional regulator, MocR family, contains an aminotransferase domain n=1 Tax=Streptoalloteichus tenebrarius (strain ATCC 17920 / DSM 40477 / JCM 4838 / CBS 697.72 / NBRC 16177 / NCIMB 11028 / NRRL B-12390 / A12253. 1 / ISP 5477) TaxID=1933 RepID=A0ABT1HPP7_STRSD|nr:DNA-binding transcriptional regulator, MocR family, contains an aminotransferase domain [Streptoalloteichus tenebrarius]
MRELQREHQVSPLTVQRVVRELAAEGLVTVRPGNGTFVAAAPARGRPTDLAWQHAALGGHTPPDASRNLALLEAPNAETVRMSGGYLDQTLIPERALAAAMARAMRRTGVWGRPPIEGLASLRQWFARQIGGFDPAEVLVTSGGQSALSMAIRALTRPGDAVVLETPTYPGFMSIARSHGLEIHPVPADEHGLRTDLLENVLRARTARLVVVQPLYANPTGSVLAQDRRRELFDLARRHSLFVLEDDYARDLTIDGPPPPTLASADTGGHVVHVRSVTKSIAPSVRLAALAARGPALARLRAAKTLDDFFVSGPVQEAAVDFLSSPAYPRHRREVARELGRRRDGLLTALRARLPECAVENVPRGGMHLWVRLPEGVDDNEVAARALSAGVMVAAGSAWFPAERDRPHLRLTYGETPLPQLVEGVRRLASVL